MDVKPIMWKLTWCTTGNWDASLGACILMSSFVAFTHWTPPPMPEMELGTNVKLD